MHSHRLRTSALSVVLLLAGCSFIDDETPQERLQMIRDGVPTGQVTLNNTYDFTIGVVHFIDCRTRDYAMPQPQVIEPGGSATYTLSAGCYEVSAGEAGLSFKHAVQSLVELQAGEQVILPN